MNRMSFISNSRRRLSLLISEAEDYPTPQQETEIASSRGKLQREIENWRKTQVMRCPRLGPLVANRLYQHPEADPLLLPSEFPNHCQQEQLGLSALGAKELLLQQGEANDA